MKVAVLCCVGAALLIAQTALTNDAVVKMVQSGLSDDLVISTIKAQPASFSTNADGLVALKTAGVSEKVIAAMVDRMAGSGSAPQAANSDAEGKATVYVYRVSKGSGPPPNSPSVYCDEQELARIQNGRYFSIRVDPGKHSLRSTDEKSVIELNVKAGQSYYVRGEVVPVKLKPRGRLTQMSSEEGVSEMRSLQPINADMVKDRSRVLLTPLPPPNNP
jgi:Protein of unknown function (DUF2846)